LSSADFKLDQDRLEAVGRIDETYPRRTAEYLNAAWAEVVAMYRSIRQIDSVKLVIVDIDDTLWRGVAAEGADVTPQLIDGWPNGFVEALCYLKRRGVLLAVVSKNDEGVVTNLWPKVFSTRLSLNDFVVRKINWRPKADNVEDLLGELNLLPRNVVFIDDNPVEREAVKAAFPDIRTFGPNPYVWRRILLWSAETQSAEITSESAARTDMVRAQMQRESHRKKVSREEFLATLDLHVTLFTLDSVEQPGFQRAMELINKTNQFNTTGKRWTQQECQAAFARGTRFYAFKVLDRFTEYGIVGVVIANGSTFEQFVMSCRVVGMDVEIAVLAELLKLQAENGGGPSIAVLRETELNLLCRDLYERCGFERKDGDTWAQPAASLLAVPSHAHVSWIQSDVRGSTSGSKMEGQFADALAVS
jgi:FkbH-like protein